MVSGSSRVVVVGIAGEGRGRVGGGRGRGKESGSCAKGLVEKIVEVLVREVLWSYGVVCVIGERWGSGC